MANSYIEIIIKVLEKKIGKLITWGEIQSLQKELLGSSFNANKFYKLIYVLKNRGYLLELKNGLYLTSYPEAQVSPNADIKEEYYRKLLYTLIKKHCKSDYYIWWTKWLELYLKNNEMADSIEVINTLVTKKETIIWDYKLSIKPFYSEKNQIVKKSIRSTIKWKRIQIDIWEKPFFIWPIELCLLESMYYNSKSNNGLQVELVKKVLKKYKNNLDLQFIKNIIQGGKYHTSINRLYRIAKPIDSILAKQLFQVIKTSSFMISL